MTSPFQEVAVDSVRSGAATVYDSVWSGTGAVEASGRLEAVMLSNDKIFVVLAVVLIIWVGIIAFLLRSDRRIGALERTIESGIDSTNAPSK